MHLLVIFSTIYLIVASMSPIFGHLALRLNYKGAMNRVFMLISLCLTLWALGFSVVILAPDAATAIRWTKLSAIGYEMIYSLLLHFVLTITGHKKIVSKKSFMILLYLPALICLYGFVLSPGVTQGVYIMENTARGWIRTTSPVLFDYIFNVYYVISVTASLLLLTAWKRRNPEPQIKKQANLLILSFFAAFGLGTLTDIINGLFWHLPIPQMAPLLFLLPLAAIFYCVEKYHFMTPSNLNKMDLILSGRQRTIVFNLISVGMMLGGGVLLASGLLFWPGHNISFTIASSLLLLALGVALRSIQQRKRANTLLEWLLILASIIITPLLTVNMMQLETATLWAFPLMLLLCALVFNSINMLLASSIPAIICELYLMGVLPRQELVLDYKTYVGRVIILLFTTATAYFIHKIYLSRLKENASQARTQALISKLATGFSLVEEDHMPQRIQALLETLLDFFVADTVLLHTLEGDLIDLLGAEQYTTGGTAVPSEALLERWGDHILQTEGKLQAQPALTARQLEQIRSTPWIFIPIHQGDRPVAFFYIQTARRQHIWSKDQLTPLPVISRLVSDALEKRTAEAQIRFMAYYDSLTGLPNRQLFYDRVEQAVHLARRNSSAVAVLFLDLDSFKSINDTMGHEGGDMLIQEISQKLVNGLRKTDTVARFGGDEFLILLNGMDSVDNISKVADKVLQVFETPIMLKGQEIFVTASAGISVYPADGEDAQTLIKHADIAMYTAKEKGKNQYAFCSSNMKETVTYRVSLTNNLYRALERNELEVYYQPQIDLQSEKITGLEALLRWNHPQHGMISPLDFISLAEQTGLINPIGHWVLETACAQTVAWKAMGLGNLRISVNLSVVQLRNPNLVEQVRRVLQRTGIDPSRVELEITESTTTKEPDYIIRVLNDLKSLGVSISIDDFGTEYSSLHRLKSLPVDRIKMDIQFVHGIDKSPKDQAISLVIINLAKNLDLKLVAEGVENSTQLSFLKNRMCDEVQGFYYYKPMPGHEMEKILRAPVLPTPPVPAQ